MLSLLYFVLYFIISFFPVSTWSHGTQGQPISFLADQSVTDSEKLVTNLIYRKLLYQNPQTGEVTLDLLENYIVIEEGLVYEVTLKKGQYWQDGVEITADDLLYTASISKNLSEVSSDKINDYSVRFLLPNKYSAFTSVLSLNILPAHMRGKENPLMPVGSSKYRIVRVKVDRTKVEEVVLINTSSQANFKRLLIKFYDGEESLLLGLKLREVDSILSNRNEEISGFRTLNKTFYSRAYLLIFNAEKEYLTQETRKNIIKSINYDQIIDDQEYPNAPRPHGPLSGTWADSESYEQVLFDPEFKFSLSNKLTLVIPKVRQAKLIAESITEQFKQRDIADVETVVLETDNYVSSLQNTDYDLVLMAHEYSLDPDRYVFWHSSQNKEGLNLSNFSSVRNDKSLEEGRSVVNTEERKKHYDIFQSVFSEESIAVYLIHPAQSFYFSNKLKDEPNIDSFYPWEILNNIDDWTKADPKVVL